jgi:hypothetical protein
VVVELETVVAIYVAAILGVKIAENWPERARMNSGSEVGDHPATKSPNAIKTLIVGSKHGWPPVWEIGVNLFRFFEECKTEMSVLLIYLNKQAPARSPAESHFQWGRRAVPVKSFSDLTG